MRLYFGNLVHRFEELETSVCMRRLFGVLVKEGVVAVDASRWGDAIVPRARSVVASDFLASDMEVLISIDSDMTFTPDDVLRLAQRAYDLSLVCGAAAQRLTWAPDYRARNGQAIRYGPGGEVVEIGGISAGFMAIHRRVLEGILTTSNLPRCRSFNHDGATSYYWPFFQTRIVPDGDAFEWLGEDYSFSMLAREAGFPSYLDPSIVVGHVGKQVVYPQ